MVYYRQALERKDKCMRDERDNRKWPGNKEDFRSRAVSGFYALTTLIVVNLVCFLLASLNEQIFLDFELSMNGIRSGKYYQLVTALFLHADVFHIFFNMFSLYIFGQIVASALGGKRFLAVYFVSGIAGNLVWLAFANTGYSMLLGASGAVMGIIMASAMIAPGIRMFLLFIPFPIQLRTMAIVFICIEFFNQLIDKGYGNIAYTAHIGGFFAGMLMMLLFFRQAVAWNPLSFLTGNSHSNERRPIPPGWSISGNSATPPKQPESADFSTNPDAPVTQRELDMLLTKLSEKGINGLTETELQRLRKAREQLRSQK